MVDDQLGVHAITVDPTGIFSVKKEIPGPSTAQTLQ